MQISAATQPALQGITRGLAGLRTDALEIARGPRGADGRDQVRALVDLDQQRQQVQVSAKALSVENQTLGSLLDLHA